MNNPSSIRTQAGKQLSIVSFILSLTVELASTVSGATTSYSLSAPTVDGEDIAYLGSGSTSDADNLTGGDDEATYIAGNRPGQGQTFTTGANPDGYTLRAVTLRQVSYEHWYDVTYDGFNVRVGTISGGLLTSFVDEVATANTGDPNNFGTGFPGPGTSTYVTWTLQTPVALSPNTEYAFDVWSSGPYFEVDATTNEVYAGGYAYSEGGNFVTDHAGDRVFHLDIAPGTPAFTIDSVTPTDNATGIHPQPVIRAIISDGSSTVDTNSIELTFDGANVTGSSSILKSASTTTVTYLPGALPSESVHTCQVVVADIPLTTTLTSSWSFTVVSYTTLPTNWAHSPGGTRGLWYRDVSHPDTYLENSEARATAQLALKLPYTNYSNYGYASGEINPYPYFLLPEDTLANNETVNMNIGTDIGINPAGNFSEFEAAPYDVSEGYFVGVSDGGANPTYFADETYGYLELASGFYTIGVNSDDGFVFYMGDQPMSLFAPDVGRFDGSRGAEDTLFGVEVQQAGLYPFRLVHYQGAGGGSLELFTVEPDGTKKLVNDSKYGGLQAYRLAEGPPYVSWIEPQEGSVVSPTSNVTIEITDGQGTTLSTYQLLLGGSNITASTTVGTKIDGVTPITYAGGLGSDATNQFTIVLSDGVEIWSNDFEVVTGVKASSLRLTLIDSMTRNGSFELLGGVASTAKAIDWDLDANGDVDNWSQLGGPTGDSGTEVYPGRQTDGGRYAFLQPSNEVFNLTDTVAIEGDNFEFTFDQTSTAGGMRYAAYLVYDSTGLGNAGGIVKINESRVSGTTAGASVGTTYVVPPGSPAIGKKIGIALVSEGDWPFIDNVVLSKITKPVIVAAGFNGTDFELTANNLLPGVEYRLLRDSDLSDGIDFTEVADVITATGEAEVFSDSNAALSSPQALYLISE